MSDPENVLAAALRAHAAGGPMPPAGQTAPPPPPPTRQRLPVLAVLAFAFGLGLLAGVVIAAFTLL